MKIKVIDLLNLVYAKKNPKKIFYECCEYEFDSHVNDYKDKDDFYLFPYLFENKDLALNFEVEIIEDKPKIEIDNNGYIITNNGSWQGRKIDIEFAKALNYLLKKSDKDEYEELWIKKDYIQ